MVKIQYLELNEQNQFVATRMELSGMSTDVKPIDTFQNIKLEDGMLFVELDTFKKFVYLEVGKRLKEITNG